MPFKYIEKNKQQIPAPTMGLTNKFGYSNSKAMLQRCCKYEEIWAKGLMQNFDVMKIPKS